MPEFNNEMRPVLIAAGGTGGHVYPALAVAEVLRLRNVPVIWMGTRSGLESRVVPAAGFEIEWISVSGLRGKDFFSTCLAPLKLLRACFQAWQVISKRKPSAVLGMGGFVAGPAGLVSVLRRLPLCIHEQNSVAGMTNRYLARFAIRVFTAFPGVLETSPYHAEVGNPVRQKIEQIGVTEAGAGQGTAPLCKVLVVGGSLGARILNQQMPLVFTAMQQVCEVRHQSGAAEQDQTAKAYEAVGVNARVDAFVDDMASAYAWADLVVCRAGAMTVSELAASASPSILVPYPHAVDDHQTTNAKWLVDADAAILLAQSNIEVQALADRIDELVADRSRLLTMSKNARSLFRPGAAECVADALQEVSSHGC